MRSIDRTYFVLCDPIDHGRTRNIYATCDATLSNARVVVYHFFAANINRFSVTVGNSKLNWFRRQGRRSVSKIEISTRPCALGVVVHDYAFGHSPPLIRHRSDRDRVAFRPTVHSHVLVCPVEIGRDDITWVMRGRHDMQHHMPARQTFKKRMPGTLFLSDLGLRIMSSTQT